MIQVKRLKNKKQQQAINIYYYISGIFITSLVVSNLIFQKFFYWHLFDIEIMGVRLFELSVGILPYPITFLITDLISEIYGVKKANQIVLLGIVASLFSFFIILVADTMPAVSYSPVNEALFSKVFSKSILAIIASMIAYTLAQFIDVRLYHFWKKLTQGRIYG